MLRSIKSGQRKVRILSFKIAGSSGSLSVVDASLDSKKISVNSSDEIIFNDVFAAAPDVPVGTSSAVTTAKISGAAAGSYLVIGSDTAEKY